jgi:uncharacterized protein (DUF3084 family)
MSHVAAQPLPPRGPFTVVGLALVLVLSISYLTLIVSLIGFASTTALIWRADRREARTADMERKRQEIELEKARLELEKVKQEQREVATDPASLHWQLANARNSLRLVQERKSQYVMETDVPLQLIKEEQLLLERITELEQRIAELE